MCRAFAAATLLIGIASFLTAQEPAPGKPITQSIDDLGNQDYKVREAAAKAIEALGPEALPALRKAKDHPDLEVRRRIREWIPRFEMQAFVVPKRINLDVKDQPLEKVVAELAKQSGYQLELAARDARAKKPITLQCTRATFWEAFDKVCQKGGLELSPGRGQPEKLFLSFEGTPSPYRSYHGAFRLRAGSVHYMQQTTVVKDIVFSPVAREMRLMAQGKKQKQVSEEFRFDFDLMAEPRLTVLYLGEPTLSEVRDDQKRSLIPKKEVEDERFAMHARFVRASRMHNRFFMGHEQSVTVNLHVPAKDARSMKVIRGTVPVSLEKETKRTVLMENITKAQGKKHKSDEFTLEIDLFKDLGANQYSVYFSIARNKAEEMDGLMNQEGSFVLEDAKGQRYESFGSGMSGGGKTTEAHIHFGPSINNAVPPGPPVRLVYIRSIPMEYHAPFEFKDLPLP